MVSDLDAPLLLIQYRGAPASEMALLEQGSISAYTKRSMGNTLFFIFSDLFFLFFSQGIRRFMSHRMMGDIYDQIAYLLNCFFRTIQISNIHS